MVRGGEVLSRCTHGPCARGRCPCIVGSSTQFAIWCTHEWTLYSIYGSSLSKYCSITPLPSWTWGPSGLQRNPLSVQSVLHFRDILICSIPPFLKGPSGCRPRLSSRLSPGFRPCQNVVPLTSSESSRTISRSPRRLDTTLSPVQYVSGYLVSLLEPEIRPSVPFRSLLQFDYSL